MFLVILKKIMSTFCLELTVNINFLRKPHVWQTLYSRIMVENALSQSDFSNFLLATSFGIIVVFYMQIVVRERNSHFRSASGYG